MQAASADALRECAAGIVEYQNRERTEDVLRIAAFALGVPLERLEGAQLLWLDRLGIYLFAATVGGPGAQVRSSQRSASLALYSPKPPRPLSPSWAGFYAPACARPKLTHRVPSIYICSLLSCYTLAGGLCCSIPTLNRLIVWQLSSHVAYASLLCRDCSRSCLLLTEETVLLSITTSFQIGHYLCPLQCPKEGPPCECDCQLFGGRHALSSPPWRRRDHRVHFSQDVIKEQNAACTALCLRGRSC